MISSSTSNSETHLFEVSGQVYTSLSEGIDAYLQRVAEMAPSATFYSHQTVLEQFKDRTQLQSITYDEILEQGVNFVRELGGTYNADTIHAHITTIANLTAFLFCEDPGLVRHQLYDKLKRTCTSLSEDKEQSITKYIIGGTSPSGVSFEQIAEFVDCLRKRRFASREHAFTEVIIATKARPKLVREIDLSETDFELGIVEVGVSNQYLVGYYDLLTSRVVELGENISDVVSEYIEYERAQPSLDPAPLFTTTHGRASSSTLRRSLKQSCVLTGEPETTTGASSQKEGSENNLPILPRDIWWYAIKVELNNE